MKKTLSIILSILMMISAVAMASCTSEETSGSDVDSSKATESDKYEIAVVTDVGQLMDKGFNQGTYEGAKAYAEANNKTFKYYQPANGSDATDGDRVDAMNQAVSNGAKIIVAPGFLQATAMTEVAEKNPDVKFVFVDGWSLTKKDDANVVLENVTAIAYKEQESGYLAGYAAVMEGYTKLGFTGGGGGTNPACNRFGYGFIQGAEAAAVEKGVDVAMNYSFLYGENFSASTELQTQISGWYSTGTEVVFACGGSMFQSVKAAALETENGKIIGVDVDQSGETERVITSAVKGLSASVQKVLGQFYGDKWDSELAGKTQNLGAADDSTGLPTDTWSMKNFTVDQYNALLGKIKDGTIVPVAEVPDDVSTGWTKVVVTVEK